MRLSEYLDCFSFICSTWELKQLWGGGCLVPDLCITYFFSKQNEQRWVQFDYQASKMLSAFILRIFAEVLQHSTCNLKIGGLCITRQRVHRHASSSVRQYFVFLLFSMFTILVNIRLGSVLGIWSYTHLIVDLIMALDEKSSCYFVINHPLDTINVCIIGSFSHPWSHVPNVAKSILWGQASFSTL